MSQQIIEALEGLGFSQYEARAYIGLLKQNPVTGYQLSKVSGIPRSRIYETLDRLTARGYAISIQSDPVAFKPLAARELLDQLQDKFDSSLSLLDKELTLLETDNPTESTWNLRGRDAILERVRLMVSRAQECVYLVGWADTLNAIQPELEHCASKGCRIVVISCGDFSMDGISQYRHTFESALVDSGDNLLHVVVDGMEVLIGSVSPDDTCEAAWSRSSAMIQITEDYIRHEVYIQKIIERFSLSQAGPLRLALRSGLSEVPHR
jgi:sugar-specific transcriptional regulator TrmB